MTADNRPDNVNDLNAESALPDKRDVPDATRGVARKAAPTPPSPKRRRWPYVVGGVVLPLLLLVLLIPTIASSSGVRSFVVGKINDNLNGRVEIADWTISWNGGITVNGVRVFDDRNSQIAQIEFFSTELSLLDAARGNLALGQTLIRGADFTAVQNPDGSVNFAKLAKPSNKPDEPASDLPNVSGTIKVESSRGTFVRNTGDPATSQKVKLSDIAATITIPDINQPIDHALSITASVNDGPTGSLAVKGKADLVVDRRVNINAATFDESVQLANLDAGAMAGFLPPNVLRELGGTLNGSVLLQCADGKTVTVRSQVDGLQMVIATGAFATGEEYRSNAMTLTLPLTLSLPNGLGDFAAGAARTDGAVNLVMDHIQFSLAADAPIATLLAAAANEQPKQPGKLNQKLAIELAPLATMLPNTLGLRPGAKLDSGRLEQSVTADLSAGQSKLAAVIAITQLDGSTEAPGPQGRSTRQRFTVQPITLDLSSLSHGGGWKAPDLRDLKLVLSSGFANGEFNAPTLASLKGSIDADLAKLKAEVGQFAQLQDVELAGKVNITADSTGDPTRPADPAVFGVTLTGTDLNTRLAGKTIRQPFIRASVNGTVIRTDAGDIKQVTDLKLATITGNEATPTLNLQIDVPTVQYVPSSGNKPARYDIPTITIAKADLALKPLQSEWGALIPAMRELDLSAGMVAVSGSGSYVDSVLGFDATLVTRDLDLGRYLALSATGPASRVRQRTDLLTDYTLTAQAVGQYRSQPGTGSAISLTKLHLSDNLKLVRLDQQGDLVVTLPKDGTPAASGVLALGLDMAQTHVLLRRFIATTQDVIAEATSPDKPVLITRGQLNGVLNLSQQPDGSRTIAIDGGVDALSIAGNEPLITDEKMTLKLKAAVGPDLAMATLEQLQLASGIATVDARGTFALKTGAGPDAQPLPTLQKVKTLSADIAAPDLAKLQAVLDAMNATAAKPALTLGPPAPVQLAAADGKLPPGTPVDNAAPPAEPSVLDQITELHVVELSVTGLGTVIGLKQPVVATSPAELLELFAPQTAAAATPNGGVATTQPASVPPSKLAGGSAAIKLEITGDGPTLNVVPNVQAQKVVLAVGNARRDLGDLALKSRMTLRSQPDGAPAPADIQPSLAGQLTITGQIEPMMELSAFLGGEKPQSAYAGTLNLEQTIGTEGTVIKVAGGGVVADFAARDAAGKPAFTEKTIRIANDLSLDTSDAGTLSLSRLALIFESSGALNLEANGKIHDFGKSRTIEYVLANVSYDASKVWQILRPMLADPETPPDQDRYREYVIEGKATRQFALAGSLPAVDDMGNSVPMATALRSLGARGSIALDKVQAEGLTIEKIELPIALTGGKLKIIDVAKPADEQLPAPYACNGGTINVGGVEIDLNGSVPLLSTPPNLAILSKVQLNAALSRFLGDLVNNPLFVPSADTKGIVDVTVVECRNVPAGKQFKQQAGNNGYAVATFDFSGAQFKNDFIVGLTGGLNKLVSFNVDADSWQGSIRNGKVTYKSGYVGHDMTLVLGEQQEKRIQLYGNTRLSDKTMIPLTMLFSSEWFGGDFSKYVPKGLPLALSGPFTAPRYDLAAAVQQTIRQNYLSGKPEDVGRIIDLFSGKKKDDKATDNTPPAPAPGEDASTRPAAKPADNPLGVLGDLLGQAAKERERKEQEKKEREKREQERRRQKQQGK